MTEQIQKGNFVELEYTGTIMGENIVFDTTSIDVAKKNGIFNPHAKYGPATVCIGAGQLLPGLDADIIGKEIGKDYAITLKPTEAFGNKDPELLNLIPLDQFEDGNKLEAGMQVQVDDKFGTIQSISGGRVVVDFNHPLSGRPVAYSYKIVKIVTDDVHKVKSIVGNVLNIPSDKVEAHITNGKATIKMIKLPEVFEKEFSKRIKELVPTVKEVVFEEIKI